MVNGEATRAEVGLTNDNEWMRLATLYATRAEPLMQVKLGDPVEAVIVVPRGLAPQPGGAIDPRDSDT